MLRRWSKVIVQHRFDCGLTRRPRQAVVERTRAQSEADEGRLDCSRITAGAAGSPWACGGQAASALTNC